jgi:type I restriction enzyme S subunit
MNNGKWPLVPLGQVASPVGRTIDVHPGRSYRTIGVKWWGEGAYERQTIDGSQTAAKSLSIVRSDDLIINKIWVRHGSTAIAGPDVDGCAASNEFPTFELNSQVVLPRWIHWLTKTKSFWTQCDLLSRGTSGKNRIKPESFLTIPVPLPPLKEQRRLVEKLDALAAKCDEAKQLRDDLSVETSGLIKASLRRVFAAFPEKSYVLNDVCTAVIDCLHSNPIYADNGIPTVRSPDVGWGTLLLATARMTDEAEFRRRTSRGEPAPGDIVVVREGGGTGKAGIVEKGQRFSLGQRVMLLRPNRDRVEPKYLLYHWLSPLIYEDQIISRMKGSASPHLNIGAAKRFAIRLPSMNQQRQVVAYLDKLQAHLEEIRRQQDRAGEEIQAMLPAVLDQAFGSTG